MLAIEIDGEQHTYEPQLTTDIQKDQFLLEQGWVVFRIPWKEIYKNPKIWILKCKKLIDGTNETGISRGL